MRSPVTLRAVARMALFYGFAGFGGGYSVLAQLRRELVITKRWIDEEDFLVLAELSKSLPGTPATTLLALLGQRVAGLRGGCVAAILFLLPSTMLMIACAAAYSVLRSLPDLSVFFDGMNAAMVAVVAAVTFELGRAALRGPLDVVLACICTGVLAAHAATEPVIAAVAVVGGALRSRRVRRGPPHAIGGPPPARATRPPEKGAPEQLHCLNPAALWPLAGVGKTILALTQVFAPIGVLTFGGGLAMVPALDRAAVLQQHWLTAKEFGDAVALGQLTPGPIAISATFIGYRAAGLHGALVATLAMFGPATALALVVGRSIERFRDNETVRAILRTLAPAVIGMLAAATISLGRIGIEGAVGAAIAVGALVVLVVRPVSPLWVLIAGGVSNLLIQHALRAG